MQSIKEEIENNPDKIAEGLYLELTKPGPKGNRVSTGVHKVKLIREEESTRTNYHGVTEEGVMGFFEENGVEKKFFIQKFITDKNNEKYGKFHYMYLRFKDIEDGTELEMEYISKGLTGYFDVRIAGEGVDVDPDNIPIIEEDAPLPDNEDN